MLYTFVWPNYVRDLGGGAREVGVLSALMSATIAATLLPGGWLADRCERKRLMVITWGLATLGPLLFARANRWVELVPGAILYCIFLGWPAMEAYMADAVPPHSLAQAFTLTNAGYSLGAMISPLVGAALLPPLGMRGLFLVAFGFFVLSTGTLAFMQPQRPRAHKPDPKLSPWRNRQLWTWTAVLVLGSWGSAALRPFLPTYLEDVVRLARPWILATSSLLAVGEVLWAAPLGHLGDRQGPIALVTGFVLTAVGAGSLLVGPWAVVPGMVLLGSDRVVASLLRSEIGRCAGDRRGVVFGITLVLAHAAQATGPLAGSALYTRAPAAPLLLGGALVLTLAVIVGLLPHLARVIRCGGSEGCFRR